VVYRLLFFPDSYWDYGYLQQLKSSCIALGFISKQLLQLCYTNN